jgi:mono/diheme cytochrome c family protein
MTVHTPIASRTRRLPAWAAGLTVFFLLVGAVYFTANLSGDNPALAGGAPPSAAPSGGVDVAAALAIIQKAQCQACHGQDLTGAIGPTLHGIAEGPVVEALKPVAEEHPDDWIHLWIAGTDPAVADIDRKGMPVFGQGTLTDDEIDTVVAYLKTLK